MERKRGEGRTVETPLYHFLRTFLVVCAPCGTNPIINSHIEIHAFQTAEVIVSLCCIYISAVKGGGLSGREDYHTVLVSCCEHRTDNYW